jgi:hypothetical protein
MASCAYCGSFILFGGVQDGEYRFCNENCQQRGFLTAIAHRVPPEWLAEELRTVHGGTCPKCNGPGPIDVHTSHTVWSILVMTSWNSSPEVCCRSCGFKSKLGAMALSGVAGWWGFPWGLIMTPIQVGRNFVGLVSGPDPAQPSAELVNIVRLTLAARLVEADQAEQQQKQQAAWQQQQPQQGWPQQGVPPQAG